MKTVRWGIVGCGDVTEVKSGPGFAKADNSSLAMVMRRDGARAEDYARRHRVPRWTDDADALITDPGVDAVYVATPPDSHKEFALRCAAAGKPILMEKPMALDAAQCEAMLETCDAAGIPIRVAYYRRAMPIYLKVKELIHAGAIGKVRFVEARHEMRPPRPGSDGDGIPWRVLTDASGGLPFRFDPAVNGGGIFVDMGSHVLDFLDFVLGPIRSVEGVATNQAGLYPAEDLVTCAFSFDGDVHGTGTWSYAGYRDFEQTRFVGSKGEVSCSFFSPAPVVLKTADGIGEFDIGYPEHVHQPLIQTVVDELTGGAPCPSTGTSALRTTRVIDEILGDYRRRT